MTSLGGTSTMVCRACATEVPDAAFCGHCGAAQQGRRGRRRIRTYAATPNEHTLLPSVTTSLFPHLPKRSLLPFRLGLGLLLVALTAFALLGWQAPLITVGTLGLPLLFMLYLHESGSDRDLPNSVLVLTAAMGIVLGVAWAYVTGALLADPSAVAFVNPDYQLTIFDTFSVVAVPVGFAALMLIPAVVIRLVRRGTRESLDGFVIGALGAIMFTAAWTLTRLAPLLGTGITAGARPVDNFVLQAGIQVVAVPLASASLGGLVGVALWYGRRAVIAASVVVTLGLYAAIALMDFNQIPLSLQFGLYSLVAAFALIALRIGVQTALVNEQQEPDDPSGRVLCPQCDTVVPDMPFCPNCGVATHAASRSSRTARRMTPDDDAVAVHETSNARLLATMGIGVAVVAAAGVTAAVMATPVAPKYVCPPDCGRPPVAEPIESNPRFVSPDGAFSVQYPGPGSAYEASLAPDGVDLKFTAGDTGTMALFGMPAEGRTPKQIAHQLMALKYSNATIDYEIPNAMVGYEPGFGIVADEYPQDVGNTFTHLRIVVMVAIRNDYALVAFAVGPYHEFTRDFGTGHPSGVNLQLAIDMGKYVNSFRWNESTG